MGDPTRTGNTLKWLAAAALLPVVAGAVCCWGPWGTTYPPLGPVTRIEIQDGYARTLRVIDDPAEVRRVVEFVDGERHGWGWIHDWAGVPVPRLRAHFFREKAHLGHFGAGAATFVCQREGDFRSKSASGAEVDRFLALIGCPGWEPRK